MFPGAKQLSFIFKMKQASKQRIAPRTMRRFGKEETVGGENCDWPVRRKENYF